MRNSKGPWKYVNPGLRMYVDLTPLVRNKSGRRTAEDAAAGGREVGCGFPGAPGRSAVQRAPAAPAARPAAGSGPAAAGTGSGAQGHETWRGLALRSGCFRPCCGPLCGRPQNCGAPLTTKSVSKPISPCPAGHRIGRLHHTQDILDNTVNGLIQATLPGPAVGYLMLAVARGLLRGIAEPRELEAVLRGLPNNVTTEMDLELWHLAVTIGANDASREVFQAHGPKELAARYADGTLPAVAQTGLRGFLDRYGHRAVAEIDLGMPRWSEKPDHILGMISNYLRVEDPEQAPDRQFARAEDHAEARIRSLVERARARGRLRARLVEFCLRRTRQLAGLRELPKFYVVLALAEMHRQLNAIGAELARTGAIGAAGRCVSSWSSMRSAWVCAVPTSRESWRTGVGSTTSNCADGGFPGSCSPTARTWRPR